MKLFESVGLPKIFHMTFLMISSYFKAVIEGKYSYE